MFFARANSIFVTRTVQSSFSAASTLLACRITEESGGALVAFIADNVFFASTFSSSIITILIHGTIRITVTLFWIGEIIVSGFTLFALISSNVRLASTFSILVTLSGLRSILITFTSFAFGESIVISSAFVTSGKLNISINTFVAFLSFNMIIAGTLAIVITRIVNGSFSVTHASITSWKSKMFSSTLGTFVSNNVFFASTFPASVITGQSFGSLSITFARFGIRKVIVFIFTLVTFHASDQIRFALTLSGCKIANEA